MLNNPFSVDIPIRIKAALPLAETQALQRANNLRLRHFFFAVLMSS